MHVQDFKEGLKKIAEGYQQMNGGPASYTLDVLLAAYDALINDYAPFKVGQRIELKKAVDFDKCPGWSGREHWMTPGARGIVRDVSCDSHGVLSFGIHFDNETWIDGKGEKHKVDSKGHYMFTADYLTASQTVCSTCGKP